MRESVRSPQEHVAAAEKRWQIKIPAALWLGCIILVHAWWGPLSFLKSLAEDFYSFACSRRKFGVLTIGNSIIIFDVGNKVIISRADTLFQSVDQQA